MVKEIRTRDASEKQGAIAWEKAVEFLDSAESELSHARWNSAGLNAIHSGICAADAVLIHTAGVRSASQNHTLVTDLLARSVPEFKGTPRTQLLGLLKMKNVVAYEQRLLTEAEGKRLVTAAKRFYFWAKTLC